MSQDPAMIQQKLETGEQLSIYELAYVAKHSPETLREMERQRQAQETGAKLVASEYVPISKVAAVAYHYPEYLQAVQEEREKQALAESVGTKLLRGEKVPILDVAIVGYTYPGYLQEIKRITEQQRKTREEVSIRTGEVLTKAQAGERLGILDVAFLARYYPEHTPEIVEYAREVETSKKSYEQTLEASRAFYTQIGYPEYGEKYTPFEVPSGYEIAEIKETMEQLDITFKPTIEETVKALGYQMGETVWVQKLAPSGIGGLTMMYQMPVEEAFKKGFSITPKGQASPIEMHYTTTATILGMQAVLAVPLAKIESAIVGKIQPKAQQWLTTKYLEKGPLEWAGFKEKLVMKLTGAKPYLAPGIVSVPTLETVGLKGMEAQQLAWELTQFPKTTGLMITKVESTRAVFTFTRGVGYTPMAVTLAKAMRVEEMGGREAIIQITKPELKTMPYLPKSAEISGLVSTRLAQAVGVGVTLLPKIYPQEVAKPKLETVPRLKPQIFEEAFELQKLRLFPQVYPVAREKERAIPIMAPAIAPVLRQEVGLLQRVISVQEVVSIAGVAAIPEAIVSPMVGVSLAQEAQQIQKQIQVQVQTQIQIQMPKLTIPRTISVPRGWDDFGLPKSFRFRKTKPWDPFGRYKRTYPFAMPKEVLRLFTGARRRRRK